MNTLDHAIPRGMHGGGVWSLSGEPHLRRVLADGVPYALDCRHGVQRDLDRCEDGGVVLGADPTRSSARALERGLGQVGGLGSGKHSLETQEVDHIHDDTTAAAFGLRPHQICVMSHCGSRGLSTESVRRIESRALARLRNRLHPGTPARAA
nr:RtcB family protein [Lentzea terrae]